MMMMTTRRKQQPLPGRVAVVRDIIDDVWDEEEEDVRTTTMAGCDGDDDHHYRADGPIPLEDWNEDEFFFAADARKLVSASCAHRLLTIIRLTSE